MAIIYIISDLPGIAIRQAGLDNEILHINGHFFMFLVLTFCNYFATRSIFKSFMISAVYGIFDELHQITTPGRSAGLFDVYVDIVGSLIGSFIIWIKYLITKKTQKS